MEHFFYSVSVVSGPYGGRRISGWELGKLWSNSVWNPKIEPLSLEQTWISKAGPEPD